MNYWTHIFFWAIVTVLASGVAFAQEPFSLLSVEDKPTLSIKGFVEIDTTTSTYPHQETADIFKKDELKANTTIKYGKESFYVYTDINAYLLPNLINKNINPAYRYSEETDILRNGTITSSNTEINFRECYINYEIGSVRLRAGNQIFAWGTADAFNPTSYFNTYDLREFLFKDEDTELKMGVPAVSMLMTLGNDTLELVITPLHIPLRMPQAGSFWQLTVKEGPFPVTIAQPEVLPFEIANAGVGARYYHNIAGFDVHLSAYHGPDTIPYLLPVKTILQPNEPVSILVEPRYAIVNMAGTALSKAYKDFVFQVEAVYSPDKTGVVDVDLQNLNAAQLQTLLPYKTRKSHFVTYSAGFNYFIPIRDYFKEHEGQCVFTFEWSQSHFFDNKLMKPMLSDIVVLRLQDSFFNDKLDVKISSFVEKQTSSYMIMPRVSYRFDSGLTFDVTYVYLHMTADSYFAGYNNNDCVTGRVSYEF
ncbi:MAG: hypothetical protein QHH74_12155 [Spirochaetota bacterium]|nr:hypothetical protein [Spirochaetota bacterium]